MSPKTRSTLWIVLAATLGIIMLIRAIIGVLALLG